jgi:AcrR family transcriptional regulator
MTSDDAVRAQSEARQAERAARAERRAARQAERASRHGDPVSRRADRREELLNAAVAGIRKHGPSATMDALASEAGITKPILYRHFGDRAGLVKAITDRFADSLMADLQTALGQNTPEPRSLVTSTIDAFVGFVEREPELYRYLVHNRTSDTAVDLSGFLDQIAANVALVIGEQLRQLGRDSGGAEPIAHGVVAFVYAAGDWWVDRRTMPRAQLVTYLADFLWDGFNGQGQSS